MPYWHDGSWGWGLAMMAVMWGALILIVYLVLRAFGRSDRSRPGGEDPDPRGILEQRFARGEISEEEYRDRRGVLEESRR